jgi:hypothetical protein
LENIADRVGEEIGWSHHEFGQCGWLHSLADDAGIVEGLGFHFTGNLRFPLWKNLGFPIVVAMEA